MISQTNITPNTPMGANLVAGGGATFRAWVPRASSAGTINRLLQQKGFPPIAIDDIASGPAQLKALVDLCHLYGIAVVFDVVYNHAGGFDGDDRTLFFWDRAKNGEPQPELVLYGPGSGNRWIVICAME